MKKILILFITGNILITNFNNLNAQDMSNNHVVEKFLKEFYTKYMKVFPETSPTRNADLDELRRKYCTANLLSRIPKMIEQTESDPFLNAQDSDSTWARSLSIKKDNRQKNLYKVSYFPNTITKITVHLVVISEKNAFRISNVW